MAATCRVCLDDRISEIDEQLQKGRALTVVAREYRYPRQTMANHRAHAILLRGDFDQQAAGMHYLQDVTARLSRGYGYATRWKNGALYAALVKEQGQLVRSLLRLDQAPDKPEQQQLPHTRLPKLDIRRQAEIILQTVPKEPSTPAEVPYPPVPDQEK